MAEEEPPLPGHFQDTRNEEPALLGSLADCQGEVCSSKKVLHLPGLLSGDRAEGKRQILPVVPHGSETHFEPVQAFGPGLSLCDFCALGRRFPPQPPPPSTPTHRLITVWGVGLDCLGQSLAL